MLRRAALALLLAAACSQGAAPAEHSRRVVYRVEDLTGSSPRTTTQVVEVASPYRARLLTREGATSLGGLAWDVDHTYLVGADGAVSVIAAVAPQFAGASLNLGVALASAQRHALVVRGGSARVGGRDCALWSSKDPLDSGPVQPPAGGDVTVSCVAANGLLLDEQWSLKGKVVRRRTATQVEAGPSLAGGALLDGRTPGPATAQAVEQVKQVSLATLVHALGVPSPAAPVGLRFDRSVAVIQSGAAGAVDVEGGVFAWTDGKRLVVLRLERGLTRRLSVPDEGVAVARGRLSPVPAGLRVRFKGGSGLVATVTANVPEDVLLAWVSALDVG